MDELKRAIALGLGFVWLFVIAYGWQIEDMRRRIANLEQALEDASRRP